MEETKKKDESYGLLNKSGQPLDLMQTEVLKEILKIKKEETRGLAEQGMKAKDIADKNNFSLDPDTKGKGILQKLIGAMPAIAEVLSKGEYSQSKLRESEIQKNQQTGGGTKGVYEFDPYKGGVNKVGDIPMGSELRNRYADPSELIGERKEASKELFKYKETGKRETEGRVQMASNLDVMEGLLGDMETYIAENPNVFITGINPLGEREFKAILSNYDKVAAIAAGGKQLTKTELDLIRKTRPTILDTGNPKAIAYKFNILKNTIGLAKERLNKGTQYEKQSQEQSQQGWSQDKESRYQELLKNRGK